MTTVESIRRAVASNLRRFREELGLTQEALAERIERSTSHVANIECAKTGISDSLLRDLCNALGRKPSELYSDIDTDFDLDGRLDEAVRSAVRAELERAADEASERILRQVAAGTAAGRRYVERRHERAPSRRVASPDKRPD